MAGRNVVILMNLGGPGKVEEIEPFLFNLFCDPDIFHIPIGQKLFAGIISKLRSGKVAKQYESIGGGSPIAELTEKQRVALAEELKDYDVDVYTAMRYWHPLTKNIAAEVEKGNYEKIILLPLYPHYSIVTVGSSVKEWFRHYKGKKEKVKIVKSYFDNPEYHHAVSAKIDETILKFPRNERESLFILFSAHSTPQSVINKGDPYQKEIIASVDSIMKLRENSNRYGISYQSKVGPVKWLKPSTEDFIKKLGEEGIKSLLVVPISFVSDHLETLFELGIEYRNTALQSGIKNYEVMNALNDSPQFIEALKNIVVKEL